MNTTVRSLTIFLTCIVGGFDLVGIALIVVALT